MRRASVLFRVTSELFQPSFIGFQRTPIFWLSILDELVLSIIVAVSTFFFWPRLSRKFQRRLVSGCSTTAHWASLSLRPTTLPTPWMSGRTSWAASEASRVTCSLDVLLGFLTLIASRTLCPHSLAAASRLTRLIVGSYAVAMMSVCAWTLGTALAQRMLEEILFVTLMSGPRRGERTVRGSLRRLVSQRSKISVRAIWTLTLRSWELLSRR